MEPRELRRVVEGNEGHASVELSGVVPGSIDPGTCHHVPLQVRSLPEGAGRGWVLTFESLHSSVRVVGGPPAHHEREEAVRGEVLGLP